MNTSPSSPNLSPKLMKGALVGIDKVNPLASIILFQYNPGTMTRRLEARSMGGEGGDRAEAYRLTGPPKETITLKVEIEATDQVKQDDPAAMIDYVNSALSALEMLLYPKSKTVFTNFTLLEAGNIEIIPQEAPMTLFVWGEKRVVPVRLTGFSVTEQAYDPQLNPLRAEVDLTLQVLSYNDFQVTDPGAYIFMAHQVVKEAMATTQIVNSSRELGNSLSIL